jgi:ATP-dependent helicase HrpA
VRPDDDNELTPLGKELSRLPLDPRVGRMILEAKTREALTEVLIIASALTGQDVRDRPMEAAQAADEKHKKFDDEKSEFVGYLKLWKWLEESKGGGTEHKLSRTAATSSCCARTLSAHAACANGATCIHSCSRSSTEHGWRLNQSPATYEQLHLSMLAGLLGNIGQKSDDEDWYLGARGIKFYRHPGAHLSKKPGRWIVAAELVDTSRLYGRGIANIEPQWLPSIAGHLIKNAAAGAALGEEGRRGGGAGARDAVRHRHLQQPKRVNFGRVDPKAAREIFIREGLVNDDLPDELVRQLPFLAHNRRQIAKVEALEHKSRRQDVLVDDELIYAYYDDKLPANVASGITFEHWYRQATREQPRLLFLTREELMRHQAAGITTQSFPATLRLGGVDCAATYLHEPGDAKDGLTVSVPLFVLNQVSEERCEWLVTGMLKDKIQALLKSLPQRPRSRLVPLPESASKLAEALSVPELFGTGSLTDVLLKRVRDMTSIDVKRADFKLDMLPPHLFMNLRVVDEHGRQLGMGRNLGALKAELGVQARGAFQALAGLNVKASPEKKASASDDGAKATAKAASAPAPAALPAGQRYTAWTFGELPELMEVRRGAQSLIGFPALRDEGDAVTIEVFDEPAVAAAKHRAGLRRLFALQLKDALKYLEKNIPDLQKMSVAYMPLGTSEELRTQIIDVAIDRAFLQEPLPTDEFAFKKRLDEGRGRLTLIANEVARLASTILVEYAAAARKIKDTKIQPDAVQDAAQQLQRLVGKRFIADAPWTQLQHFARYLKAIVLRLDKLRADPARDAAKLSELKPQDQRYWRLVAERKGVVDDRMLEFRWLLEELRVSFFAQELRTPQPVSVKRLDKAWAQLQA